MIEASSVDRDQSSRSLALEQRPFGFIFALALCRPPVNCWMSAGCPVPDRERVAYLGGFVLIDELLVSE